MPYISGADEWEYKFWGIPVFTAEQASAPRSGTVSFLRELLLIPSYCAVNHFSEGLFKYESWKNDDNKHLFLLDHISLLFEGLENLFTYFDKNSSRKDRFTYRPPRTYHVLYFFFILVLLQFLRVWLSPIKRIIRRLNDIHKRIQASEIFEASRMPGTIFPFWRKKYQHFHSLDERQAENLLLQVLEDNANNFLIQPHIIFLFDELDKIHPHQEKQLRQVDDTTAIELGLSESVRKRQHEIEQ